MSPTWLGTIAHFAVPLLAAIVVLLAARWLLGVRYIPHHKVGVIERMWSFSGSLTEGRIITIPFDGGEAMLRHLTHLVERKAGGPSAWDPVCWDRCW